LILITYIVVLVFKVGSFKRNTSLSKEMSFLVTFLEEPPKDVPFFVDQYLTGTEEAQVKPE
jgi:hypothetical protein